MLEFKVRNTQFPHVVCLKRHHMYYTPPLKIKYLKKKTFYVLHLNPKLILRTVLVITHFSHNLNLQERKKSNVTSV